MSSRVESLRARRESWLKTLRKKPSSSPTNRASNLGHPCLRYLVYCRTRAEDAPSPSDTSLQIFREGDNHETDVKIVLAQMGVEIFGSQRSFPPNDYNISGHVDGETELEVWEVKSVNPTHWQQINENDAKSMLRVKAFWVNSWYTQTQLYMFLADKLICIYVLKNKITGEWKIVQSDLDLDYVEKILDKAERVNEYISSGETPDYYGDPAVCKRCVYAGIVCDAPLTYGSESGLMVYNEPNAIESVEAVLDNQAQAKLHTYHRSRLREILEPLSAGKDMTISIGPAIAKVSWSRSGQGSKRMNLKLTPTERRQDADSQELQGSGQDHGSSEGASRH